MEDKSVLSIFISQLCALFRFAHTLLATWTAEPAIPRQLEDITWEDTQ